MERSAAGVGAGAEKLSGGQAPGEGQWQDSGEVYVFLTLLVPTVRTAVPEQLEDQLLHQPLLLVFPSPFSLFSNKSVSHFKSRTVW